MPFTPPWNTTGQPAASLPLHTDELGLPVGVQIVGRPADEATLFRAVGTDRSRDALDRPPPTGLLSVPKKSGSRLPKIGAHVAPDMPLRIAADLECDQVQIFLSDPQSFKKPVPRADADELKASPIDIVVHAPYLINVCSPKSNVRYGSRNVLKNTMEAAEAIDAKGVIVHGGHADDDVAEGFGRWVRTLESSKSTVPIWIENTPGGKNAVAKRFDDLAIALGRHLEDESFEP